MLPQGPLSDHEGIGEAGKGYPGHRRQDASANTMAMPPERQDRAAIGASAPCYLGDKP